MDEQFKLYAEKFLNAIVKDPDKEWANRDLERVVNVPRTTLSVYSGNLYKCGYVEKRGVYKASTRFWVYRIRYLEPLLAMLRFQYFIPVTRGIVNEKMDQMIKIFSSERHQSKVSTKDIEREKTVQPLTIRFEDDSKQDTLDFNEHISHLNWLLNEHIPSLNQKVEELNEQCASLYQQVNSFYSVMRRAKEIHQTVSDDKRMM